MVAAWKNESELSEAKKKVRSKTAKVVTGKGNSVLAVLTEQVVSCWPLWTQRTLPYAIKEIERDSKIQETVQGIRDWTK